MRRKTRQRRSLRELKVEGFARVSCHVNAPKIILLLYFGNDWAGRIVFKFGMCLETRFFFFFFFANPTRLSCVRIRGMHSHVRMWHKYITVQLYSLFCRARSFVAQKAPSREIFYTFPFHRPGVYNSKLYIELVCNVNFRFFFFFWWRMPHKSQQQPSVIFLISETTGFMLIKYVYTHLETHQLRVCMCRK